MGFKVVQCNSCGGELQLDENKEFGFCSSCGAKIMLRETVEVKHTGTVSIDYKDKIRNTMEVADNSFKYGRYDEARKYYLKALEYDLDNPIALVRKDISIAYQTNKDNYNGAEIISGYKTATRIVFNKMNELADNDEAGYAELQNLLNICTQDMVNFAEAIKNGRMNEFVGATFEKVSGAEYTFRVAVRCTMDILDDILYAIPVSMTGFQDMVISFQRELGNMMLNAKVAYVEKYVRDNNGVVTPKIVHLQLRDMPDEYQAVTTFLNRTTDIVAARPENKKKDEEFRGSIEELNGLYTSKTDEYKNISRLYKERKKEAPKCFGLFGISGVGVVVMLVMGLMAGEASWWISGSGIFIVALALHIGIKSILDKNYMKNYHPELTNNKKQAHTEQKELKAKIDNVTKEYETFRNSL